MRTRNVLAVAVATLTLPLSGAASQRILASGKLFAAQTHDFSCSVVNKADDVTVTIELKNPDGTTYINPSTFQPATLQATLGEFEAAMLTAPAGFVGQTTLYCWAEVPFEAVVFGNFLVRDGQDRATSAVPLKEDLVGPAVALAEGLEDLHTKLDELDPAGPLTGLMRIDTAVGPVASAPGQLHVVTADCVPPQLATGGGCHVDTEGGDPSRFYAYESAPTFPDPADDWRCRWRNNSATTEAVTFRARVICGDAVPEAP